ATDKVDSEVPSTAEGVIEEILYNVNDVVPIGKVIARIKTGAAETAFSRPVVSAPSKEQNTGYRDQEAVVVETIQRPTSNIQHQTSNGSSNRFYSPLVLNIA